MPPPRRSVARDQTFYPVSDDMGEHELQTLMLELLRPLLARFLAERGVTAHAGSDQFIYWERGNAEACVAPDLYVLPGVSQERVIETWKTWREDDVVPSLAVEIVTTDVAKDYEDAPPRYADLGVRELVIYDPKLEAAPRRIKRWRFQVYRRTPRGLVRVIATNADRVRSHVLGAWLRVVGEGMGRRLRIATGLRGEALVTTDGERADAERDSANAERQRADAARVSADAERARADAERARADRLEARLARVIGKPRRRRSKS